MPQPIGRRRRVITEGHRPPESTGPAPAMTSHEIESDVPVVVQHTRLDSRQAARGLLSTVAFARD